MQIKLSNIYINNKNKLANSENEQKLIIDYNMTHFDNYLHITDHRVLQKYKFNYIFIIIQKNMYISDQMSTQTYVNLSQIPPIIQYHQNQIINNKIQKKLSNYKYEYLQYFKDVDVLNHIRQLEKDKDELKKHKISIMQKIHKSENKNQAYIVIQQNWLQGLIFKYEVFIQKYKICGDLLNINSKHLPKLSQLGSDAYGNIYKINMSNRSSIVAKRIIFQKYLILTQVHNQLIINANKQQIQQFIFQYSLNKICSFYQVGPHTISYLGFDLVCNQNYIQFFMELCHLLYYNYNYNQLEIQLKHDLKIIHQIKMIHKDIKPHNILYSQYYQKYIFCDFGISHFIKQQLGQYSDTYRQGTPAYMSKQMTQIKIYEMGKVDLYYNDLMGLKQRYQNNIKVDWKIIIQNKMKAISKQYLEIYNFYKLINLDQEQLIEFLEEIDFDFKFQYYDFQYHHKIFDILTKLIKSTKIQAKDTQKINKLYEYLIQSSQKLPKPIQYQYFFRCYGLTNQLLIQLSKYQNTYQTIYSVTMAKNNCCVNKIIQHRKIQTIYQNKLLAFLFYYQISQKLSIKYYHQFPLYHYRLQILKFHQRQQFSSLQINYYLQIPIFSNFISLCLYSILPINYYLNFYILFIYPKLNIQNKFYSLLKALIYQKKSPLSLKIV